MRHDYDVIVVGARVAGASTAMLLARQGHRVLLLDRTGPPADTISTHAILRTGVLQLTRWGVLDRIIAAGTPRIGRVTLGFGVERVSSELRVEHGVGALYAPRRTVLDTALLDAAVADGAEFAPHTRVTGLLRAADGRVNGVTIDRRDRSTAVTARYVIGADGVNSRVAAEVGARSRFEHPATNSIHYAYYTGIDTPGCWFQFTPGVNAGLIPTNDAMVCVFAGRPTARLRAFHADPEAEFRRLLEYAGADLAARVAGGTRATPFRGTAGLPGFMKRPVGPGWALVGDAGFTKDPISAHGISDALRDAELCAHAIHDGLIDPTTEGMAMAGYEDTRNDLSRVVFDESARLARYRWTADQASTGMRNISSAVRHECDTLIGRPATAGAGIGAST